MGEREWDVKIAQSGCAAMNELSFTRGPYFNLDDSVDTLIEI